MSIRLRERLRGWLRDCALMISFQHRECATTEISQIVGQLAVDPLNKALAGEVPIQPKRDLAHQKIANRVYAELVHQPCE